MHDFDTAGRGDLGMCSFKQEDWMYSHSFFEKNGVRQAKCYFTSYDPTREVYCLLMEDLNTAGYSGGDQLSGGPGKDEPPHAGMFLSTMEVLAKFNVRTLNKINDEWEGNDLREIILPFDNDFLCAVWPGVTGALLQISPGIFEAAGIQPADDPSWAQISYFIEKQVEYYHHASAPTAPDLYNLSFIHGDARSENVFFPLSREGIPALIDFQLMKQFVPAHDAYYFLITSVPTEWRQANELEMMNVYLKG